MDEAVAQAILARLTDGRLRCADAFVIARALRVQPLAVGQAANEAGIRISCCQLGLFGYGPKAQGLHKIVQPLDPVPAPLAADLRAAAEQGAISCARLWQIAKRHSLERIEVAGAAEALALRVSDCQLGCFPRRKGG